ncbi:MAG: hypothetical protein RRY79_01085 [Clostridia bacterium]
MRRIVALIVAVSFLFTLPIGYVFADEEDVRAFILGDGSAFSVLSSKEGEKALSIAGLSRLLTILIISEAFDNGEINPAATIKISADAANIKGSTAFLKKDESMSAENLFKAAVMISAGDAIYALTEVLVPDRNAFISRLKSRADALDVDFAIDDALSSGALVSATAIYKVAIALVKSQSFLKFSGLYMDTLKHENAGDTELVNPNKLVKTLPGCIGLATGSSIEALYCGVYAVRRGEMTVIVVIIGAKNAAEREKSAAKLAESAFTTYKKTLFYNPGDIVAENVEVSGGIIRKVNLIIKDEASVLVKKSEKVEAKVNFGELIAPIATDIAIGNFTCVDETGATILTIPIYPDNDVEFCSFWDCIVRFAVQFCGFIEFG